MAVLISKFSLQLTRSRPGRMIQSSPCQSSPGPSRKGCASGTIAAQRSRARRGLSNRRMSIFTQLLDLPNLQFEQVSLDDDQIEIRATTTRSAAPCPSCGARSPRVHSHYQRILQDLPWGCRRLRIMLQLRRFRCQPASCVRQTFVERLPLIAPPYARVTTRLRNQQPLIACAVTGELGARLTPRLGIPCSADALLRLVRQAPIPSHHHRAVSALTIGPSGRVATMGP